MPADDWPTWDDDHARELSEAAPGAYRLRSTGETVVDPDFTTFGSQPG